MNKDFMADKLGGTGLQKLALGGREFFIKMCNHFLIEYYICKERNCYNYLPNAPGIDFYYAPHLKCHCGDRPAASSSNGGVHAKRRREQQGRVRQEQQNVPDVW